MGHCKIQRNNGMSKAFPAWTKIKSAKMMKVFWGGQHYILAGSRMRELLR